VVALIYIDRIIQRNASFMITSLNIHRLLITRFAHTLGVLFVVLMLRRCRLRRRQCDGRSVMVAAKFFDDIYYDNAYYAKVIQPATPCGPLGHRHLPSRI